MREMTVNRQDDAAFPQHRRFATSPAHALTAAPNDLRLSGARKRVRCSRGLAGLATIG